MAVKRDPARGTWYYVIDVPGRGGRRQQLRRRGFPTKKAAATAEAEVVTDVRHGRYVRPSRSTLGEYLLETWLPDKVAEGRRLSRETAVSGLIERYTRGAVFTTERQLARLFGLASDEVTRAVKTLARARAMRADCAVDGWPGRWLIHGAATRNARSAERS